MSCKFCGHSTFYRTFKTKSLKGKRFYEFDGEQGENGSMLDDLQIIVNSIARCENCNKIVAKFKPIVFTIGTQPLLENIKLTGEQYE